MSRQYLPLLIISALFLGGCIPKSTPLATPSPTQSTSPQPTTSPAPASSPTQEMKKISLDEISKHTTAKDCWFAIGDGVYDVTSYIAGGKHPGGEAVLEGCGKDATELFNTRPMGSGTPHSDKARQYLKNFQIGILEAAATTD